MKRPGPPSIITVAVITTITIIFWIFFSVYQILTGEVDVNVPQKLLKPIRPTLNQEILNKLSEGLFFEKDEVRHFSVSNADFFQSSNLEEEPDNIPAPSPVPSAAPVEDEEIVASPAGELIEQ